MIALNAPVDLLKLLYNLKAYLSFTEAGGVSKNVLKFAIKFKNIIPKCILQVFKNDYKES